MGPLGHTLSAASVYLTVVAAGKKKLCWKEMAGCAFLANLPDFDLIGVLWLGLPAANRYHHSYTHTFAFALAVGAIMFVGTKIIRKRDAVPFALFGFIMAALHVIGDFFTRDTGYPYGEMLFWPVSDQYFLGPSLFLDIHKGSASGLFSLANLKSTIHEFIIFSPIVSWLVFAVNFNSFKSLEIANREA